MLLDMNAGRIRYDYVERLQASVTRFETDLLGALEMVTDSLKSVLNRTSDHNRQQLAATMNILDSIRRDCEILLR
jgi:hypothetical protein